jgi:capsid protein
MMVAAQRGVILAPNGRPAWIEAMRNNWYEGSRWSPNRSWIWYPLQDAKKDLDRFTRYELNKHARYLYKNSPLIRGLIERLTNLTVGCGFTPVVRSDNPVWNKKFRTWWRKKSRNPHLGPRVTMSQYQRCIGRARFNDGECFSIKTSDNKTYEEKIQGAESERVGGNKTPNRSEEMGTVDGFDLDAQGTVTAYNFRGVETPYPAEYVVHHFTPTRLGQYRGETILAAAINTARDVDDILALEKDAVKDASSKRDIIKTASGELDPEMFRKTRYNFPIGNTGLSTVFNLPADDNTKDDYYEIKFGGKAIVLRKGDEYDPHVPQRPGGAWQGFMDFLANTICLSTNLPPSVVLPINVGGTDIRRDLDIAQRVVEPWQLDIACELDEILDYFMESEMVDGDLRGAPTDYEIHWHFPPKLNVDRAQAAQDRQDVQAGLMSVEEYHARYGDDADLYDEELIKAAKRRKQRILDAGFETPLEFLQIMSLNWQAFSVSGDPEEETEPDAGGAASSPAPAPKKKAKTNA